MLHAAPWCVAGAGGREGEGASPAVGRQLEQGGVACAAAALRRQVPAAT